MNEKQLIWKNTVVTIKRERIYFFSMSVIAMLMFAFHAMIFSEDVQEICEQGIVMDILIGFVTIFIVIVNSWFIHYMMKYALKNRSLEFGLYMLFGKTQKEVAKLFKKETIYLARIAFCIGFIGSLFLKQFLMIIFYHMFRLEYKIDMDFHIGTLILTYIIYFSCYRFSLIKIKKRFMNMTIYTTNQIVKEHDNYFNQDRTSRQAINVYLLKGNRLFLWRNISSQIRTMKRVIVFVSILLMISIVGSSIAMMYTDYQNKQIDIEFPFDIMIYHKNPNDTFEKERKLLEKEVGLFEYKEYRIYQNGTNQMRNYLYTNLDYFGERLQRENGTFDEKRLKDYEDYEVYYSYDTFISHSDYEALCNMLGENTVALSNNEYILQIKDRIYDEIPEIIRSRSIVIGNSRLTCKAVATIPFEQNGHNGADYLYVIPDDKIKEMKPYYSVFVGNTDDEVTYEVTQQLEELGKDTSGFRYGSNHSILYTSPILAKKEIEITLKSTITAVLFPFAYVSFVFLCIALAILSIHMMSSAEKNKNRYEILKKLGMTNAMIHRIMDTELAIEFFIPLVIGLLFGSFFAHHIANQFTMDTGLKTVSIQYVFSSLLWILIVYLSYFIMTERMLKKYIMEGSR